MRRLSIARPECVAEDFDGEIVALNLDTGLYFSLPGLAGAIWRDLISGFTADQIVSDLAATDETLGPATEKYIQSLIHHGLLREGNDGQAAASEPEYRAFVAQGDFDLTFTAHDDMKDLVMTDPIHDVDETVGWPSPPNDGG